MTVKADAAELKTLYLYIQTHVALYHRLVTQKFILMKKFSVQGSSEDRENIVQLVKEKHQRQKQTVKKLDTYLMQVRETLDAFKELNTTQGHLKSTIKHGYDSLDRVIKRFEKQLRSFEKRNDKHEKILERLAQDVDNKNSRFKLQEAMADEVRDLIKFLGNIKEDLTELKMIQQHEISDIKALSKKELNQIISNLDKGASDAHKEVIKKTSIMPAIRAILRNVGVTAAAGTFWTLTNVVYRDNPDMPLDIPLIAGMTLLVNMMFLMAYNELKRDDLYDSVRDLDPKLAEQLKATFQAN